MARKPPTWSRYRPASEPTPEKPATSPSGQPGHSGQPGQSGSAAGTEGAAVGKGCLSVFGVIGALALIAWFVTALMGGDVPGTGSGRDDEVDPAAVVPLDAAEVAVRMEEAVAVSELSDLPATHMHVSPDGITIDFYDEDSNEERAYSRHDGGRGYEVRVKPNPFDFVDDLVFDLDDVDPEMLAQVSAQVLAEVDDPAHYGLIVGRDLGDGALQFSMVVTDTSEDTWIVRTDTDGDVVETLPPS